mgnify:FL=1
MSYFKTLLAAGAAATALTGVSNAQLGPLDYSSNWQPLHNGVTAAFSGPGLFGAVAGDGHYAGFGDSTRRCYGIDSTQGGRNQSIGRYETTYIKVAQGWAANNTIGGTDYGVVSVQAGSDADIGGDACVSPWFKTSTGSSGHNLSAVAVLGLQTGTAGAAFPSVWESAFRWVATSLGGSSTLGTDQAGNPLLINLIYEVQGPLNGGANNNQYYLASTAENTGNSLKPGGVSNGNIAMGAVVYGADAQTTGAFGHSRITSNGTGGLVIGTFPGAAAAGDMEAVGGVAFQTPALWGTNDGNGGAGGCDWRVASAPVSVIDIRLMDTLSGGQTNTDIYWKTTLAGQGPAAVAFDPNIVFNGSYFLWSATSASAPGAANGGMIQTPMSWSDLGGFVPPQPGSIVLGPQSTTREGFQTIPANFDALMTALLPVTALSLGGTYSGSDDIFLDGQIVDAGGSHSQLWEGMFDPIISGISTLPSPLPIVGAPTTNLAGFKLGIAGVGLQVDTSVGFLVQTTEVANAMTVNFQP